MRGLAVIVLIGCTPGEEGDAYVLADAHAVGTAMRVDGEPIDAALPVAAAPQSVLETDDGAVELGGDEVALVQGSSGRVTLYVLGVDLEPGLVEASGPEEVVTALADDLGVDLEPTASGWLLGDPEIWPLLASAEPTEGVVLRPVSGEDLPGTAPIGDAGVSAVTPSGRGSTLASLFGVAPRPAGDDAQRARLRAEALFALEPGAVELAATVESRSAAALVGRYCTGAAVLTLGANGTATACDDVGCRTAPWSAAGGEVAVFDGRFAIEPEGRGQRLVGREELVDLVIGGCP